MAGQSSGEGGTSAPMGALTGAGVTAMAAVAVLVALGSYLGIWDGMHAVRMLIGVMLVMLAGVAITARSGLAADHFMAGHGMGPVAAALAGVAVVAFAVAGVMPGLVYQHGFDALLAPLGIVCGLVLMLTIVGPVMHRADAATLPHLIGMRFGTSARLIAAGVAATGMLGLLIAAISLAIDAATRITGLSHDLMSIALAISILSICLPAGLRSVSWAGVIVALLVGLSALLVLAILSYGLLQNPLAHIAYGAALRDLAAREVDLIEAGRVDFGLFKSFVREFLNVDALNWGLIALVIAAAVAVLPPLISVTQLVARPSQSRSALAYLIVALVVLMTAVPAVAALMRLEVYRAVESSQRLPELPRWVRAASQLDAVRIHGVSSGMLEYAASALREGAASAADVADYIARNDRPAAAAWLRLDASVHDAVLRVARGLPIGSEPDDVWRKFQDGVVPVAAEARGAEPQPLALGAITLSHDGGIVALTRASGLPIALAGLLAAAVLGAAVVGAAALTSSIAAVAVTALRPGAAHGASATVMWQRGVTVAIAGAAAAAAQLWTLPKDLLLVGALSLLAAGLFPAVLLTIWWKRTSAAGCIASMLAGMAAGGYYFAGSTFYPVTFYDTWHQLSSAGPAAYADYEEAKEAWLLTEGEERSAGYDELASRTAGALWSPGLANWFGVAPAANAVIAIPIALLVAMLISLLTPARRAGGDDVMARMHHARSLSSAGGEAAKVP